MQTIQSIVECFEYISIPLRHYLRKNQLSEGCRCHYIPLHPTKYSTCKSNNNRISKNCIKIDVSMASTFAYLFPFFLSLSLFKGWGYLKWLRVKCGPRRITTAPPNMVTAEGLKWGKMRASEGGAFVPPAGCWQWQVCHKSWHQNAIVTPYYLKIIVALQNNLQSRGENSKGTEQLDLKSQVTKRSTCLATSDKPNMATILASRGINGPTGGGDQ